jgi:para-aminobenzoate synthetase component I
LYLSLPLLNRTGSEIFDRLFRHEQIATLLESPANDLERSGLTRYSICAGSPTVIADRSQVFTPAVGKILDCLRDLLASTTAAKTDLPAHLPFTGGWLGWLGYELAWEIEQLPDLGIDPLPFPVAYWYEPSAFAVLDHWEQVLYICSATTTELDRLEARLDRSLAQPLGSSIATPITSPIPNKHPTDLHFLTSAAEYQQSILQAQQYIQAGDIFQANLSLRFSTQTNLDSWQIYQRLQAINPSPFASYWQTPWGAMMSCSPERLVRHQETGAKSRSRLPTSRRITHQYQRNCRAYYASRSRTQRFGARLSVGYC